MICDQKTQAADVQSKEQLDAMSPGPSLNPPVLFAYLLFFCSLLCITLLSPGPIGPSNLFSFLRFVIMGLIVPRSQPYTHFFLHTFLCFFFGFFGDVITLLWCIALLPGPSLNAPVFFFWWEYM